jgi:hypothetical protein
MNKKNTKAIVGMGSREDWPDPTPEMLADQDFNRIWEAIKTWDINVPGVYQGYCGATGNHARAILDALRGRSPATERERTARRKRLAEKWDADTEKLQNLLVRDMDPDAVFKWNQLVTQELNMWCQEPVVSQQEFDFICERRGFNPEQVAYMRESLAHAGIEIRPKEGG